MNSANNIDGKKPVITKESKNRIRVDYEGKLSFSERMKAKMMSSFFIKKVIWYIFRLILLVGISYIVLYPFFSKIMGSFMAREDFIDATVILIPKHWTLQIYKSIFTELNYMTRFLNTLILSGSTAVLQTFTCATIAYGLAKFRFKGGKYIFLAVILTMVIPHNTLRIAMYQHFNKFDILGIFKLLAGGGLHFGDLTVTGGIFDKINIVAEGSNLASIWKNTGLSLSNTFWPLVIMSLTGLAFKNGLYIFLLRQFFTGVPNELEESAYMDGSGPIKTFIKVIIPLSVPMLITVFLFAFSWQWTDEFYAGGVFMTSQDGVELFSKMYPLIPESLDTAYEGKTIYESAIRNTSFIMIIAPLVIMYVFCQNFLVQGIERSGLTAD